MAILTRAALLVALLANGCERSPTLIDVAQRSIAMHALLIAESDSATVLLTRPARATGQLGSARTEPVVNAHVRLVHGADTIFLSSTRGCVRTLGMDADTAANAGCYSGRVPGGVRPGGTYGLLAIVPGEAPIHGTTRVPVPPQILEPDPTAEPPVLSLRGRGPSPTALTTRWSGAEPRARTELRFVTDPGDCISIEQPHQRWGPYVAVIGADTVTVMASTSCGQRLLAGRYAARLVVTVYDENYTRYLTATDELLRHLTTQAGITGALGVFGAAASSAVPVVLLAQ
jgi:hypothetical protein